MTRKPNNFLSEFKRDTVFDAALLVVNRTGEQAGCLEGRTWCWWTGTTSWAVAGSQLIAMFSMHLNKGYFIN